MICDDLIMNKETGDEELMLQCISPEDPIQFCCAGCDIPLLALSQLCFYYQNARSLHLIVKHECAEQCRPLFVITPQMIVKRLKIAPYVLSCLKCGVQIGSEVLCGPRRESVFCFPPLSAYFRCSQVGKYQKNWGTMLPLLPQIERRSTETFYGGMNAQDILLGQRLQSLPKTTTKRPDLGTLAMATSQLISQLPLNLRPRSYQLECLVAAATSSTNSCIVYLPTGAGKTLVSVLLLALFKQLNPQKLMFFLVDRVPLVFQQGQYLQQHLGLSVLMACGEQHNDASERELYSYDVICCTAQLLLNFLQRRILRMEDVSVVVFDEIHHAAKKHPYALILEEHLASLDASYRPQILGLTASPAHGPSEVEMSVKLDTLKKMALNANAFTPVLFRDDLELSVNRPAMGFVEVEVKGEDHRLLTLIHHFGRDVLLKLTHILRLDAELFSIPECNNAEFFGERVIVRKLMDMAHQQKSSLGVHLATFLLQLMNCQEMISVLGCIATKQYLLDILRQNMQYLSKSHLWTEAEKERIKAFTNDVHIFQATTETGKAQYLLKVLQELPLKETTRGIVFVETKKTARWLCSMLRDNADLVHKWNPMYFVGQTGGDRGQSIEGMTWSEHQEPLLQAFRQGNVRLLISTSVLQEGLDVPSCDIIILFDRAWSLTNFVQSRGRARSQLSQYILICSTRERHFYEDLLRVEHMMLRLVLEGMMNANGNIFDETLQYRQALSILHLEQLVSGLNFELKCVQLATRKVENKTAELELKFSSHLNDDSELILTHLQTCFDLSQKRVTLSPDLIGVRAVFSVNYTSSASLLQSCWRATALPIFADSIIQLNRKNTPFVVVGGGGNSYYFNAKDCTFGCTRSHCEFLFDPKHALKNIMIKLEIHVELNRIELSFLHERQLHRIRIPTSTLDDYIMVAIKAGEKLLSSTELQLMFPLKRPPTLFFTEIPEHIRSLEAALQLPAEGLNWQQGSAETFHLVCPCLGQLNALCLGLLLNDHTKNTLMEALLKFSIPLWTANLKLVEEPVSNLPIPTEIEFEKGYALLCLKSICFSSIGCLIHYWSWIIGNLDSKQIIDLALSLQCSRFYKDLPISSTTSLPKDLVPEEVPPQKGLLTNVCLIKMIVLTPTRMIYEPPKSMALNRITRAFPPDNFVRVQFRDDDLYKLTGLRSAVDLDETAVVWPLQRISTILSEGFTIQGKHFEFLAMSSSQLRDHGCWFVTPFFIDQGIQIDAEAIRQWMGDFSHLRNVAKYVARLGQSLSASIEGAIVNNTDASFEVIPDVQIGKYCFTDGIGMISKSLAQKVATKLDLDFEPCAYQIRFAGFKGVVALIPNEEGNNISTDLKFRPSMRKFESEHRRLEVLNVASYIPCFLNRQVIMILSGLGVPDESFQELHNEMLLQIGAMLLDLTESRRCLAGHTRALPKIDFSKAIHLTTEPFLRKIILAVYQKQLGELLTRTRVFVPKGRILMGAIDELGLLKEDEVFVQCRIRPEVDNILDANIVQHKEGYFVVTGEVAIAKNPCMHPGDVRRLKAVFHPQLAACRWDVLVFPSVGNRPITDMCSGSDLDGDLYFCTWDSRLLPPSVDPPMEYDPQAEKKMDRALDIKDVRKFVVDFIANDALGSIANAHVAHVDQRLLGVRDPLCKELAFIFSQAVDFPKTGVLATLPPKARVQDWPDFMHKPDKSMYVSKKVIGRLFRQAKLALSPSNNYANKIDKKFWRPLSFSDNITDDVKRKIKELYASYSQDVKRLLSLYGIPDECQIVSGCLSDLGLIGKEDIKDTMDIVMAKFCQIQERHRVALLSQFSSIDKNVLARRVYQCVYDDNKENDILSFAWLLGDHLFQDCNGIDANNISDFFGSEPLEDVGQVIAEQMQQWIKTPGMLAERLTDWMDRLRIANLVQQQLASLSIKLELTGSTAWFVFTDFSDINLVYDQCDILFDKQQISLAFKDCLNSKFSIVEGGKVLKISFEECTVTISPSINNNKEKQEKERKLLEKLIVPHWPICQILVHWALHFRLIRHGPYQLKGKLSIYELISLFYDFLEYTGILVTSTSSTPKRDLHDHHSPELISYPYDWRHPLPIEELFNFQLQSIALLRFFQFLTFASEQMIDQVFSDDIAPLVEPLRDVSLRTFHLVAQTLNLGILLEPPAILVNDAELAAALTARSQSKSNRFKLMRRSGGRSSGYFMAGCTNVLFWSQKSRIDKLQFVPFHGRRRPQHWDKPCHIPRLLLSNDDNPESSFSSSFFARGEFFAHFQRQLLAAFKLSSALDPNSSFGPHLKLHIRLGHFYIVNLSRMLLEDLIGGGCPWDLFNEALQRTFKRLDNLDINRVFSSNGLDECLDNGGLSSSSSSSGTSSVFMEEKGLMEPEDDSSSIIPSETTMQRESKRPHLAKMIGSSGENRKKLTSPMTSAFEPIVVDNDRLQSFLDDFCELEVINEEEWQVPTYSLSAPLSTTNTDSEGGGGGIRLQDHQLIFDLEGNLVAGRTRPLRWLVCDLSSSSSSSSCNGEKVDDGNNNEEEEEGIPYNTVRFALRSSKPIDIAPQVKEELPKRIFVKLHPEPQICRDFCFLQNNNNVGNDNKVDKGADEGQNDNLGRGVLTLRPIYLRATTMDRKYKLKSGDVDLFDVVSRHKCKSATTTGMQDNFIDSSFKENLIIHVQSVREYFDLNVDTGFFAQHWDKTEVDCQLMIPWDKLCDNSFISDVITRSAWTFGSRLHEHFNQQR